MPNTKSKQNSSWNARAKRSLDLKQHILKMNETKAERGTLWGDDEVMSLIEIWADEGLQ